MRGRLMFVAGAAVGYVLGAKAGRGRYEELKSQADTLWKDPRVQEKVGQAQTLVSEKAGEALSAAKDKAPDLKASVAGAADAAKSKVGDVTSAAQDKVAEKKAENDPGRDMLIGEEGPSDYTPSTVKFESAE